MRAGRLNIEEKLTARVIDKAEQNIALNAFRTAVNGSLTQFNMIDGIVDEYEDESGIKLANTKLLLNFNGTDGATSSTDESDFNHILTFVGDAQLDTAQQKFGTASLLLDGTGDYVTVPDSTDWNIFENTTDNWTIDFFVKHTDHSGNEMYLAQGSDGNNNWRIQHSDGNGVRLLVTSSASSIIFTPYGGEITDTNWHHIALVKVGDEYGIYVDGTQVGYVQDTSTATFTGDLHIGSNETGGSNFDGWIDGLRIYKGNPFSASPNSTPNDTITVPTGEPTADTGSTNISYDSVNDLYSPSLGKADSLVLLLDGEGTDTSTSLDDLAGNHILTFNGNAQIDTAQFKFGSSSMLFDGTGDYISIPADADFTFGTGDFTIDLHVKFNALGSQERMLGDLNSAGNSARWGIQKLASNNIFVAFDAKTITSSTAISDTNWHHIRCGRNGNTIYLYIDGVAEGTVDATGQDFGAIVGTNLGIGRHGDFNGQYFAGWIDAVRIQKGVAVDSSGFTPPSEMYATNTEPNNMNLNSTNFTAQSQPDTARIVLFEEDVDSITLNTDLKAYASRDDGTTWSQITLVNSGEYEPSKNILSASVDISGQPAGTDMKYKIETLNNKDLKLHGASLSWD